jgi:hypothetical protein
LNQAGPFEVVRKTIQSLAAQTRAPELEVVIVTTPEFRDSVDPSALQCFGAWQIVELPFFATGATGFAAGARAATAEWFVLCEDHCYPPPHWAASLLKTAADPSVVAIGPSMANPNAASLASCANFLMCFVEWYRMERSGPIPHGPGHNSCYRRETLLEFFPELERWFNPERVLFLEFERRGYRVVGLADVVIQHVNISKLSSFLGQSFHGGRVFGDSRSRDWPFPKRLFYAALFFLVPPLRFARIFAALGPARRASSRFWPAALHMIAGLCAHAFGEAAGYSSGAGSSPGIYANYELRRRDYVLPEERKLLELS